MRKTILITGASSGIGKATARHFQAQGWNVVATMRQPENETELTTLPQVLVTRLDVQDSASIHNAVADGLQAFGSIDVLLNNAGYGAYGPLEATPMDKVRRQFDVNVIGLLETTKAVLPHFRARRSGTIINISSIGGQITFPLGTLYHGTKFAVEGLSEALGFEMEAIGVRVKLVEPGVIRTDFAGRSFDFTNDASMADYQPLISTLLSVMGQTMTMLSPPELVAQVIFDAATDGSTQLRYTAGEDAKAMLASRKALDDASFLQGMRERFGL